MVQFEEVIHAQITCGLQYNFGCRALCDLSWTGERVLVVMRLNVSCNIPTFEALLQKYVGLLAFRKMQKV